MKRRGKRIKKKSGNKRPPIAMGKRTFMEGVNWPLFECKITESWQEPGAIIQIMVSRKNSITGIYVIGSFLVDLACLGIKDAASLVVDAYDYKEANAMIGARQKLINCDLDFAAKVVQTAVEYSGSLGFKPHKDFKVAKGILGNANPADCTTEIPTGGPDGKPYFIQGPYDNVAKIIRTLDKSVGPGNYNIMTAFDIFADDDEEDYLE